MTDPEPAETISIETATQRLSAALDALELAVERRLGADREEDRLADRIQALSTDRARLANELDAAAARKGELELSNRDIARRLDTAIASIRNVLESEGA